MAYHFGIPGWFIWVLHIIFGLFLAFTGYKILNKQPINQIMAIAVIVAGVLAVIYHGHIWFIHLYPIK